MRTFFLCLLTCLFGLAIGLMVNLHVVGDFFSSRTPTQNTPATNQTVIDQNANTKTIVKTETEDNEDTDNASAQNYNQEALLKQAYAVMNAMKQDDFAALSELVHPTKGVCFTPYSNVDPSSDRTFKAGELSDAKNNSNLYIWGLQDGSGFPIQLTITDYFKQYVYNADYASAPIIGINTVISSGNSLENVAEAYPDAYFVEFYFPGIDAKNKGFDWCGLKLVFEADNQNFLLIGVIHSEWTI